MNETSTARYGHRPEMISDDDQRERDGIYPTEYDLHGQEASAQRDELERQVRNSLRDAEDWLSNTKDDDAQAIYDLLREVHERLGDPPEDNAKA